MQEIKNYIFSISPLSEAAWQDFSACFRPESCKANFKLTEAGKIPTDIYFLKSGLVRAYFLTADGKEYSKTIFSQPSFFGSIAALIQQTASLLTFESLTPCSLYVANYKEVKKLYDQHRELDRFGRLMMEQFFIAKEKREIELVTLPAKDRYLNLQRSIPNIDLLIPQYQIASHLGISPTQLSRIRRDFSQG